jgi:hypothetical protein
VVAYHGGLVHDLAGAIDANVERMAEAETLLLAVLASAPASHETLMDALLDRFTPSAWGLELHALHGATVRGYLASLEREGRIEAVLEGRRVLWRLRR